MELIELNPDDYLGKSYHLTYQTKGYYDIIRKKHSYEIVYRKFDSEQTRVLKDCFFSGWLEDPIGYGIVENGRLLGYVEGSCENWNNRFRISNLCIFDRTDRHRGLGSLLMDRILQVAKEQGARMAVLETQSCNEKAIAFYKKHGFTLIGFDLFAYSNTDPQRHEIRLEMGLKLDNEQGRKKRQRTRK